MHHTSRLPPIAVPVVINRMSDAEIDSLTGPIALYPDPLVAIILPASTFPLESRLGITM